MKKMRKYMRKILYLLCVLGAASTSFAQSNRAAWANLNAVQAGTAIQVHAIGSTRPSGRFLRVSDTALSYTGTAGEQSIAKQDVLSVKVMKNRHRLRNTLIVAGVGAGVGAGIGAATHKSCPPSGFCLDIGGAALPAAVGAVLGGLGGAVVGALLPSHQTIYDVAAH
jgi:hypothetical protein